MGAGVADHGTSLRGVGGDGQEFCVRLGNVRQVFEVAFGVFDDDDGFRPGVGQVQFAHCHTHGGPCRDEKRVVRVCLGVGQLCHECALLNCARALSSYLDATQKPKRVKRQMQMIATMQHALRRPISTIKLFRGFILPHVEPGVVTTARNRIARIPAGMPPNIGLYQHRLRWFRVVQQTRPNRCG